MSDELQFSRRSLMRGAAVVGGAIAVGGVEILRATPVSAEVPDPGIASTATWGARAPGSLTDIDSNPDKILIHHTVTANQDDTSQEAAFALCRAIQNYHMDNNGWSDTGQHFTVSRGGYAMEGRHHSLGHLESGSGMVIGAHCPGQNDKSIGIENEGTYSSVAPPGALYDKLVELSAHICQQYGIAPTEIYGHRDFWSTACPGDVLYGMLPQLRVDVEEALNGEPPPPPPPPGWQLVIDNTDGGFSASGNWGDSSWSDQRYGDNYMFTTPVAESDAAYYSAELPADANYHLETWYPSNAGYNSSTPFVIFASSGSTVVHVNQQTNGGQWVDLGTHPFAAGSRSVVAVSRWTTGSEYIIADAVRITQV